MANVLFMRPFALEELPVTITASHGGTIAPRLFTIQPEEAWSPGNDILTGIQLDVALDADSAAVAWDGVLYGAHNHAAGFQWRLRRATSLAGLGSATGNDDSGLISGWPASGRPSILDYPQMASTVYAGGQHPDWRALDSFYRFPTAALRSHLRLNLEDGANPDDVVRAGLLRVGRCWQPSRNFGFGWRDVPRSGSWVHRGTRGPFAGASGARWREVHLTMGWLRHVPPAPSDWLQLRELLIWANNVRDIVVLLDPDSDVDRHVKLVCGVPTNGIEFINHFARTFRADLVISTIP